MSKRTRRQNKRRMEEALKNYQTHVGENAQKRILEPESEPKRRTSSFSECREKWFEANSSFFISFFYLVGIGFWALLGTLGGYPLWLAFAGFGGGTIWFYGLLAVTSGYRQIVKNNRMFYSRRSWFRQFFDFIEDELDQMESYEKDLLKQIAKFFFVLPVFLLVLALIYTTLLVILVLDWMRLLVIGFVNLCTAIFLRTVGWAYVFGVILGSFIAFPVHGHPTTFMLTALFSGLIFVGFFFYKEARKKKYGTPYFPT